MRPIEQLIKRLETRSKGRNFKPKQYIKGYLASCQRSSRRVQMISHWCLSPRLSLRFNEDGSFQPLNRESKAFKVMADIAGELQTAGLEVDWFVLLTPNFVGDIRLPQPTCLAYKRMLLSFPPPQDVAVLFHEEFGEFKFSGELHDFPEGLLEQEILRRRLMYQQISRRCTEQQLRDDSVLNLSAEAEEARWLVEQVGDFIEVPLVSIPRFASLNQLVAYIDRLLPVLPLYPWRPEVTD